MGANNFTSGLRGPNDIVFKDGHHIRFGFPSYRLGGTVYGERSIEAIGSCTFEDVTNKRKAVVLMNTFKKTGWIRSTTSGSKDQVVGVIYDSKHQIDSSADHIKKTYCKDIKFVEDLDSLKDIKKKICEIEGSWLNKLKIGGKTYFDIDKAVPSR